MCIIYIWCGDLDEDDERGLIQKLEWFQCSKIHGNKQVYKAMLKISSETLA